MTETFARASDEMRIYFKCFQASSLFALIFLIAVAFPNHAQAADLDAEVSSISIEPMEVETGNHPEVTGYIQNKSGSKGAFDVKVSVTLPDKSKKAWWWDDSPFQPNQKKVFPSIKGYDISQAGSYLVEYSVYDSGRTRLLSRFLKSFTVKEAAAKAVLPPAVPTKPVSPTPVPETKPVTGAKTEVKPQPVKSAETAVSKKPDVPERRYIGIGGYANTINPSYGPTLILWPLENLAIQGSYGWGTFESYEIRGFYKFRLSSFNPYIGGGYIHAERKADVIGVNTTIKGNSYSVFGGVEIPIVKDHLSFMADVSYSPMKLEEDVTNGSRRATAEVDYKPVTVGAGIVWYAW